jgi:L-2-hydroxyglutarate oxidase LhgO
VPRCWTPRPQLRLLTIGGRTRDFAPGKAYENTLACEASPEDAGLYYEPGSLKARLCHRGVDLLAEYAAKNNIAYDECGKVVVAHNSLELDRLHSIFERAEANGVPDVAIIDRDRLRELEPACTGGIAALHSPHTAIIDYPD